MHEDKFPKTFTFKGECEVQHVAPVTEAETWRWHEFEQPTKLDLVEFLPTEPSAYIWSDTVLATEHGKETPLYAIDAATAFPERYPEPPEPPDDLPEFDTRSIEDGRPFKVTTAMGTRTWTADDADHAREQHEDAFPDEAIENIDPPDAAEQAEAAMDRGQHPYQ
jgi:hypothetical protein